ncbi:MAG: tripartite tricarboxylate transporter substrate binding protein [Xanthobacteraceae bacterium]|nr:tripartite tricarboxylate transporter substrate binding protein [Xanthobacteraceae bacterium]
MRIFALAFAIAIASVVASLRSSHAEEWPVRAVTLVVPYAAGGPNDAQARVLAARLGELLHQQIIIENVGGAGGMTGANRVAKAAPDGYTLLLAGLAIFGQIPTLYKKPPYNPVNDFEPVALVAESARILIVRKDLPVSTLPEFVAYARSNQEHMQYASAGPGSGSHVCAILLDQLIGTNIAHVPYRGTGPAMQDLLAGRIDFTCEQISTAYPLIKSGQVKAIATLAASRQPVLGDVATAQEQGVDLDCSVWIGLAFPKDTPRRIVDRLAEVADEAVETPALRERFENLGISIVAPKRRTPAYFARFIPAEIKKWAAPIRASGVIID